MGLLRYGMYGVFFGLIILLAVFAFSLMDADKSIEKNTTTTKWIGSPIAKETSVTKSKTSFSAVPTNEERGS